MLECLCSYLQRAELGDDPFVRLESISFVEDGAELSISVRDYQGATTGRWGVKVRGLRDYRVTEAFGDLLLQEHDHVLARQHLDPQQLLYFRGTPPSALETVGRLLIVPVAVEFSEVPPAARAP
jgi:hypothetical protein